MIAYIVGNLIGFIENSIIVENNGLGYLIKLPPYLLEKNKNKKGDIIELYISHQFIGESQQLFGFESISDLESFQKLLKIHGVGVKLALQIISSFKTNPTLILDLKNDHISSLKSIPGVGEKTAKRIFEELKGCFPEFSEVKFDDRAKLAVDALVSLGVSFQKAKEVVIDTLKDVQDLNIIKSEDIITMAIQRIR
ncbi:Holliday junction ATP-dependent DNA helicase ruvA [Thermodesulfobium narugense DSM 14796]|uniref:Holliday junction branch migration complex subunit RuvA n=1 Tax=Thermodesulfobium narugense DSM 14796 TaxID=747365 RepID=M1E768_9BACT|nr:Holliday junction branch migration protein RuvA [Thermodesulfobium narugense]AEE14518.1 Holliday junction ATP-dependent DNA helicase ruvA [Thermodesulfobium narugense DSM 14796]